MAEMSFHSGPQRDSESCWGNSRIVSISIRFHLQSQCYSDVMFRQLQPLLGFLFLPLLVKIRASDPALVGNLQQRITHRRGYMVPINTQITLSCPFETPFYKWSRPEYPSHLFDETKNITILADSLDVSGRYQCSAVNGFGNSLAEMAVRVIDITSPELKKECALSRDGNINEAGCDCRKFRLPHPAVAAAASSSSYSSSSSSSASFFFVFLSSSSTSSPSATCYPPSLPATPVTFWPH
ncbi:hypothetical protein SprV_0100267500 [Sparganum proliferum]